MKKQNYLIFSIISIILLAGFNSCNKIENDKNLKDENITNTPYSTDSTNATSSLQAKNIIGKFETKKTNDGYISIYTFKEDGSCFCNEKGQKMGVAGTFMQSNDKLLITLASADNITIYNYNFDGKTLVLTDKDKNLNMTLIEGAPNEFSNLNENISIIGNFEMYSAEHNKNITYSINSCEGICNYNIDNQNISKVFMNNKNNIYIGDETQGEFYSYTFDGENLTLKNQNGQNNPELNFKLIK